jgi:tetratricopeptide (TPR) repeat protein
MMQPHLGAYVDGELEEALRGDVEEHLQECRPCREAVRDIRLASAVLGKWKNAQPDVSMVETVGRRIREEQRWGEVRPAGRAIRKGDGIGREGTFAVRALALAAAILLVLGAGFMVWQSLGGVGKRPAAETVASLGRAAMTIDKVEDLRDGGLALQGVIGDRLASARPDVDAVVQLEVAGTMMETASDAAQGSDVGKILNMLGKESVAGRLRKDMDALAEAAGAFGTALVTLERVAADEPSSEDGGLIDEAMKLEERGELEAALEKFKVAGQDRLLAIRSLLHEAGLEMKLERAGDAIETLKKALDLTKPDTFNRELVMELKQRAEEAMVLHGKIEVLRGKLVNTENEFEVLSEIGNLQVKAGNLTGAKETCDRIIRQAADPAHVEGRLRVRLLRAWCLREMNRYAPAFDEFESLITDAGEAYPDVAMLAQYERAKTFQLRGRFAEAVDDYTDLSNTPGISPAFYAALEFQVGYIFLHDIGDAGEAAKIFKQLDQGAYRDQPFGRLAAELVSMP